MYLICAHIIKARGVVVKAFCLQRFAMSARPLESPRFVRRTQLGPNEYRKNFRQIDGDVISAVTSREADGVTPLMSKIYLRLVHAPARYWEREGVLRFEAEPDGDSRVKAWDALCELAGVASATASKALRWMHEQGIIGYFAGKNGVGIRIFLNRATSSIGSRAAGKKILEFPPASSIESRASRDEAAFSDSYAVLESLETDLNPRAPKNGAKQTTAEVKPISEHPSNNSTRHGYLAAMTAGGNAHTPEEIRNLVLRELEPALRAAAAQAAAHEHERTREWLESRGLPKAARVAQREAYNVLRQHGLIGVAPRTQTNPVDGHREGLSATARPLSPGEVKELAETCMAMLEVHGQAINVTLSGLSAEAGGILLAEDAPKVRDLAESLVHSRCRT